MAADDVNALLGSGTLDGVGGSLVQGAARLESINEDLAVVAVRLRDADAKVIDAGEDLAAVGSGLREGGAELARFAGPELPKPKTKSKPKSHSKPKSQSKPKAKPTSDKPASGGGLDLGRPS